MPIYAYKCESCGAAKDVLQKISDPALTDCPACGQPTFRKQVTAAGFQLKGSGWYVTDFRNGAASAAKADADAGATSAGASASEAATTATPSAPAATSAPAAAGTTTTPAAS